MSHSERQSSRSLAQKMSFMSERVCVRVYKILFVLRSDNNNYI